MMEQAEKKTVTQNAEKYIRDSHHKNISIISGQNDGDTLFSYSVIFQDTPDQAENHRYLRSGCRIHRNAAERYLL